MIPILEERHRRSKVGDNTTSALALRGVQAWVQFGLERGTSPPGDGPGRGFRVRKPEGDERTTWRGGSADASALMGTNPRISSETLPDETSSTTPSKSAFTRTQRGIPEVRFEPRSSEARPLTIDLMGFRDVALVLKHKANRCGSRGICRWLALIP
jgi:hypothetical protein